MKTLGRVYSETPDAVYPTILPGRMHQDISINRHLELLEQLSLRPGDFPLLQDLMASYEICGHPEDFERM
jgi:hypothetical protein